MVLLLALGGCSDNNERRFECPEPSGGNLVADGEFDGSYFCWWAFGQDEYGGGFRTSPDHPDATSPPSMRIENDEIGDLIYDTQLFTLDDITMVAGHTYQAATNAIDKDRDRSSVCAPFQSKS